MIETKIDNKEVELEELKEGGYEYALFGGQAYAVKNLGCWISDIEITLMEIYAKNTKIGLYHCAGSL